MNHLKSAAEIKTMTEAGRRLKQVVTQLKPYIKEKISTKEIDSIADSLIRKLGCETSFKKVKGYRWATCLSINEQVVHTPPSDRVLKKGDVFTIDIGVCYRGFHSDFSDTFVIGDTPTPKQKEFLRVGKTTLMKAINQCKENNYIGDISATIEQEIYGHGYFVIKQLTGHGIGRRLHEDPYVFGYLDCPVEKTPLIKKGLVVAIEVIYSLGSEEVVSENGGWSLVTKDGSLAACFEHTVAVTGKNTLILT
ncbi:type I methionyl aminopeptidase [Candidatus Roizmanbacteria bacterium CG02_land_8_20_14_3_00_36_15]|uniref:Methionine aminopeptidase n=2 Tax=Candidatus Roizmaniibacteriota TaxID=1752723 RepID=A0A2M8KLT8_9BACT|nr:MAG: type I methionyl aminopeptidase [Candidatus Roizmanbacteria bacterium CG03_land_8_20_14_0_80_36_21]PIV37877.1 MAG: type I methionyl aminopeptidase [Candidatus Roizmanbacteria bacterium CG02_land_8_20_14_3_00_36_15]PIY70164.1 MAG: type I methionyl aminopeptidase [Candidatus Roizmanbacteria bacterium CG_4_10_14_0_8_um_filter_36_36]PJA53642.1 MAG: type I methionyl aminopeptidase [Candidatus Roizmanbacteria bacterium CG_4_9_14_3_um_filter_36_11]PJC81685.1 MAG: type I methionyl aminopeptidas